MEDRPIRKWIQPGRLVPLLTILGAAGFVVAGWFRFVTLTIPEGVIISLLCLLAVDALVERLNVLEKVERHLKNRSAEHPLRKREGILTPDRFARHASSVHILAISGISIVKQFENFYRQKIKDGCRLEFLLLRPDNLMIEIWKKQNLGSSATKPHIISSLEVLRPLSVSLKAPGSCEVRLLDMFAPFSIVGLDFEKSTARMIVEFHGYKTSPDERAHILLTRDGDPFWFRFYMKQFQLAWADSGAVNWEDYLSEDT
jgi:hypothetical protein